MSRDPSIDRNLDTQVRQLDDLETRVKALLDGEPAAGPLNTQAVPSPAALDYESLTAANDVIREQNGWSSVDLAAGLTPEDLARLEERSASERVAWSPGDYVAVGVCAVIGVVATVFDDQIDTAVREAMKGLLDTDLLSGWEQDAKGMPIDYAGTGFGGPAHRVRSAGHDIGRPFEALRQIRAGSFEGFRWHDGVRETVQISGYVPVTSLPEALVLWLKHLTADVVTPMSLPLPGWTKLYELPVRDIRKFANEAYAGSPWGRGLNIRSGSITPSLPVLATETIVRTHVHWNAYQASGSAHLSPSETSKLHEMLLAGHALVGAAALTHAVTAGFGGEGPLALQHVNAPALIRTAVAARAVRADVKRRADLRPPTWDELAGLPWEREDARLLADILEHR